MHCPVSLASETLRFFRQEKTALLFRKVCSSKDVGRGIGVEYISSSPEETFALAKKIAAKLPALCSDGLTLCLEGEMGGGKTAFAKGLLAGLHYSGEVTSPTFSLCNRYDADITVYHMDLYRLSGEDDLFSAGVLDHLEEKNTLSVIEWADRANGSLFDFLTIGFSYGAAANERIITLPAILAEGL